MVNSFKHSYSLYQIFLFKGEFVMIHAAFKSHIATDCLIAPDSKLADNIVWLVVVKAGISRTQLLQVRL